MATNKRIVKLDENEFDRMNMKLHLQKAGIQPEKRRAALGNLGNKVLRNENSLKPVIPNLKDIKARVDTHWKKTNPTKKLSRSDSLKSSELQQQLPKLVSTTTTTTITNVMKMQATTKVIVQKATTVVQARTSKLEKPVSSSVIPIIREESNLTRRSLCKIRAVIKDGNKDSLTLANKKSEETEKDIVEADSHSSKLLKQIENIDINDEDNPLLLAEYVNDIYAYLHQLEVAFPIRENHLEGQREVTPRMRAVLVDWINEVHYQFHLVPETYHMAVAIIDRYLQEVKSTPRKLLQLVGVTALFIASKYEELYPPEITDFVFITDDTYNKRQILDMEKHILKKLQFNMSRPLSIHFLRRFSKAAKAFDTHHLLSKYIIELCSIEYTMSYIKPSLIAAGAINLALQLFPTKDEPIWTPTLEYYSSYSSEKLKPIVKQLALLVLGASNAKLKAVYNKYQSSKFDRISAHSELSGSMITSIAEE